MGFSNEHENTLKKFIEWTRQIHGHGTAKDHCKNCQNHQGTWKGYHFCKIAVKPQRPFSCPLISCGFRLVGITILRSEVSMKIIFSNIGIVYSWFPTVDPQNL